MNEETFVLKDDQRNYVGKNSLSYDKLTKKVIYSYSEYLTNGFYTYQDKESATSVLQELQEKEIKIKSGKAFHIEGINKYEVLLEEYKRNAPKDPFKHILININ